MTKGQIFPLAYRCFKHFCEFVIQEDVYSVWNLPLSCTPQISGLKLHYGCIFSFIFSVAVATGWCDSSVKCSINALLTRLTLMRFFCRAGVTFVRGITVTTECVGGCPSPPHCPPHPRFSRFCSQTKRPCLSPSRRLRYTSIQLVMSSFWRRRVRLTFPVMNL